MQSVSYFTSESVCPGHPDKVCDQIADALLDRALTSDRSALADFDVAICPDHVIVMGKSSVDIPDAERIVRNELARIGYTKQNSGIDPESCDVAIHLRKPSFDVSRSVHRSERADAGSSDGGMCIGYACNETASLMPAPIEVARKMVDRLTTLRTKHDAFLLPDGKVQVCYQYKDGVPFRVQSVILCAQHTPDIDTDDIRDCLEQRVVVPEIPDGHLDEDTQIYINPTGFFMTGGPNVKPGCTGRKTDADFYGSATHHIGSSVSGKDPSKTTRPGSYMARYIAKNVVAAHVARACEVRISYAIGLTDPVCVSVDLDDTSLSRGNALAQKITDWISANLDLRPEKIIERFDLRRPIYHALSCFGNVGAFAQNMPWERTDIAKKLSSDLEIQ